MGSEKSALVYEIDGFPVNLNLDRPEVFVSIASSRFVGFPMLAEGLSMSLEKSDVGCIEC